MNKCVTSYVAAALLVCCTGSVSAQDRPQAAQTAVDNMAKETVECAAYFDIVSLALMNSKADDTAEEYIKARKLAVGRANSLSPDIVNERYNSLIKEMTKKIIFSNIPKDIADDLSNVVLADISVLRDQYGKSCKEVMDSPGARGTYWMQHADGSSR
jgi:hypothetical protein